MLIGNITHTRPAVYASQGTLARKFRDFTRGDHAHLAAAVTDLGQFRLRRQSAAARLGLAQRQNSSSGKKQLVRITKMSKNYMSRLLVTTPLIGQAPSIRRL